jgi:rubrerythrin
MAGSDGDRAPTMVQSMQWDGDYECLFCGYGISPRRQPGECPMCQESAWRPFSRMAPPASADEWKVREHVLN